MKRPSLSFYARVVALLIMIVLMPWWAKSRGDFGSRAFIAVLAALAAFFLIRYGLSMFHGKQREEDGVLRGRDLETEGTRFKPLNLLRLAAVGAMFFGLVGIVLEHKHAVRPMAAFFISLVGQQGIFVAIEVFVISRVLRYAKVSATMLALIGSMVLSVLFAWSSDVIIFGQRPGVLQMSSNTSTVLFSIPAVIVGAVGILKAMRSKIS